MKTHRLYAQQLSVGGYWDSALDYASDKTEELWEDTKEYVSDKAEEIYDSAVEKGKEAIVEIAEDNLGEKGGDIARAALGMNKKVPPNAKYYTNLAALAHKLSPQRSLQRGGKNLPQVYGNRTKLSEAFVKFSNSNNTFDEYGEEEAFGLTRGTEKSQEADKEANKEADKEADKKADKDVPPTQKPFYKTPSGIALISVGVLGLGAIAYTQLKD